MNKLVLLFSLILINQFSFSQVKWNINGIITDSTNGEKIQGAYIQIHQETVSSNSYGFFNIQSNQKNTTLTISSIGYAKKIISLNLHSDTSLAIQLLPENVQLQEIIVSAEKLGNAQLNDALTGKFKLAASTIKKANIFVGESDVMKTLQLLPGVQSGTDGSSGVYVRGGSTDQNLILLDGIPVYNINHLFGFLSIFNTNAISNVNFLKGGIPASYGGRLSSVIDISLKEGNQKNKNLTYSIGPILTNFSFETPLKKDTSSLLISFRKSLLDLLFLATNDGENSIYYGFYDGTVKWNYTLNEKNKIYFSFYSGRDSYNQGENDFKYKYFWGNNTFGTRWNRIINQKLFLNSLLYFSKFEYKLSQSSISETTINQAVNSGIQDIGLKLDFDYFSSNHHQLKWGLQVIHHQFSPEIFSSKGNQDINSIPPTQLINTFETNLFLESNLNLPSGFSSNIGFFTSNFFVKDKSYLSIQPRINLKYALSSGLNFYGFFNRNVQYLHLLSNSSLGLSTDLWVPATNKINPESANTFGFGFSKKINSTILVSLEAYQKYLYNVLEYKEGVNFFQSNGGDWQDRIEQGKAFAKGIELYVETLNSNPKTWLSYAISKTDRLFENLNNGQVFPFKFDRRHNLSINSSYSFNKETSLSITFVLNSGWAATVPAGRFLGNNISLENSMNLSNLIDISYGWDDIFQNLPDYQGRNNFRTPLYHRLDINYSSTIKKKRGSRTINIGFYNIYNQLNGYLFYQKNGKIYKNVLFPILPAFSYERSF